MRKFLFVCALLLFSGSMEGHEIRPAYLQIIEVGEFQYEVYWKVPRMGDAVPKIRPIFPEGFELEVAAPAQQTPDAALYHYLLKGDKSLRGTLLRIGGLNKTLIDVLVSIQFQDESRAALLLQADKDRAIVPEQPGPWTVIKSYTILGIEHILLGIDHLLFVLALVMITKGKWRIVKTITAFTVAHSITLSFSALNLISLPGAPVEAVIALSIVFLAWEIQKVQTGQETLTSRKPWIVAFSFGLLHGFGFAGALSDIGLPENEIPLALAFFNIGVELGQLFFVALILIFTRWLLPKIRWPKKAAKIPPYAIGIVASFWVVERVLNFWT